MTTGAGTVGQLYRYAFTLRLADGAPRTGAATEITPLVRNPARTATEAPTVVEDSAGEYHIDISAGFTSTHGAGNYSIKLEVTSDPRDTFAETLRFFVNDADSISDTTRFSTAIPRLDRPTSGSTQYRIRVNLEDTGGNPEDPDANTITVNVENQSGASRNVNLDSTTMTRLALGRYEVLYTVDNLHTLEQLIFEFTYTENSVAFTRDATQTVTQATSSAIDPVVAASGVDPSLFLCRT